PVGRYLEAQTIDLALALLAQAILHFLEEIEVRVPRLRDVLDLEARLLHQWSPDMTRGDRGPERHAVDAVLLGDGVVGPNGLQRVLTDLGLLGLHDIADVDPLVLPPVYLQDLERVGIQNIGDHPAGDRRDDL